MTEQDLLNNILSRNPNLPATHGAVVLLRLESKSEFQSVRSEIQGMRVEMNHRFDQADQRLDRMELYMKSMAEQIGILVERSV